MYVCKIIYSHLWKFKDLGKEKKLGVLLDIFIFYLLQNGLSNLYSMFCPETSFLHSLTAFIVLGLLKNSIFVILVIRNILLFLELMCYSTMTTYFWLFWYIFVLFQILLDFLHFQVVFGKLMHEYCGLAGFLLLLAPWEKEGKGAVGSALRKEGRITWSFL